MKLPLKLTFDGELRVSCHQEKSSNGKVRLFVIINIAEFAWFPYSLCLECVKICEDVN